MHYLRGFAPWIVYACLSPLGWQWSALAGLVTGLALIAVNLRAGMAPDALILECSTAVFFVALTAVAFAAPHSSVSHYGGALSFAWLAVTSWATLALRRPFTLGIARRTTPEKFWHTPQFLRINVVITAAWAAAFTLTAIALTACGLAGAGTGLKITIQVLGFAAPAVFTARYPKIMQARYARMSATG
ncbi:hypothetical protein ABZ471_17185 [Streptomyces sp. NPDC005728]|uniref:hypothetical protein n=1 Tax=Streptomyces sp. NPDC005728 TaxID=3157054 RepID=UPI0033C59692